MRLTIKKANFNKVYKVGTYNETTSTDINQFWSYMKYQYPGADQNKLAHIISVSTYQLDKIKQRWGDKFYFEIPNQ
jgi:hypothetical protein